MLFALARAHLVDDVGSQFTGDRLLAPPAASAVADDGIDRGGGSYFPPEWGPS